MIKMNFLDIEYENQESTDTLKEIVDIVSQYDIYDFISRLAGLNLMPENQNKSVLLDSLVEYILRNDKSIYVSNAKMSPSKFKKVMDHLNNTFLSASIDPCENTFTQNIMFSENNYRVFNGIDSTPAYNLQVLIRILFQYNNDYPEEFLNKCFILLLLVLEISEEIASGLSLNFSEIKYDEQQMVILPSSEKVSHFAKSVKISMDKVLNLINNYFDVSEIAIEFGNHNISDYDNRVFYTRPFLLEEEKNNLIILNISLLPIFAFYKVIEWACLYGINEKVINRYNEYQWLETEKSLNSLGHKKVNEESVGLRCIDNNYYKEMVVTVYNNQQMLVVFLCDDGYKYPDDGIHIQYPDDRHNILFKQRLLYFEKKNKEFKKSKRRLVFACCSKWIWKGNRL